MKRLFIAIQMVKEEEKIEKLLKEGYTKIYNKNKLVELYNGLTKKSYKVKYSR